MRISDWSSDVCSSDLIFRRFHSVRPNNEEFGQHSGLGLAIARSIVEGHHGTIRIVDREDSLHGARFEVRLPAAAPLADRSEEHTSELQSLMRSSYAVFCLQKKKR